MTDMTSPAAGEPLSELLAGAQPSRPAFVVPESGQVLTYEQVAAGIETLAQRLAGAGVRRGDRAVPDPRQPASRGRRGRGRHHDDRARGGGRG